MVYEKYLYLKNQWRFRHFLSQVVQELYKKKTTSLIVSASLVITNMLKRNVCKKLLQKCS